METILIDDEFDLYLKDFDSYMFTRKLKNPMDMEQFIQVETQFFNNWISERRNNKLRMHTA